MLSDSERRRRDKSAGFTLVELVAVLVILGIMAAYAVPKFFDLGSYSSRAAYDEVAGALRYAQKLAVASGCDVRAVITTSGYTLQQLDGCTSGSYNSLDDSHPVSQNSFSAVTISPEITIKFDAMGRADIVTNPEPDTGMTISVGSRSIEIIAETGYVDAP
jgi:MSHA pilin protein MshC